MATGGGVNDDDGGLMLLLFGECGRCGACVLVDQQELGDRVWCTRCGAVHVVDEDGLRLVEGVGT